MAPRLLRLTSCALTVLATLDSSLALDNGLGLTPRLAFSTWNFFGPSASEDDVRHVAAALKRTGLFALGFDTINIDAGSLNRDQTTGRLVPSGRFPSGLRNLSDWLHGNGYKFGAYNDISGHTCGNGPAAGSLHHYDADAATFAHDWQIDYLKIDFCGVQMPGAEVRVEAHVSRGLATLPPHSPVPHPASSLSHGRPGSSLLFI